MPAVTADERIVPLLLAEWESLDALLTGLDDDRWSTPTCLPGWDVRDIVAHLVGTESVMAGEPPPPSDVDVTALPHVLNDLAARNELWVRSMRTTPPAALLARFRDIAKTRGETLSAMGPEGFDAPSWTPVGQGTYRQLLHIRLFDCWLHEQDIRDAVGQPGHETGPCAEAAVDQMLSSLGFVVAKRAGAPDGTAVTLTLTGPVQRTVHVVVDGHGRVVPELDRSATATLAMSSNLFVRLAGGRVGPDQPVDLGGDTELGRRVVGALAVTP
ncbi:MAG TPA: maleylpyruvate isomerase family mycothiol-dependent enzyme [Mycobacteriales bacterium]|jgi:uncharacterized protein (TIGR03083 family)